MKNFDLYEAEDREKISKLPCPFCYAKDSLSFSRSYGYGSHFSDSCFICSNCKYEFSISDLLPYESLEECEIKMSLGAKKYHDHLLRRINELENEIDSLRKKSLLWKKREQEYNPSKRKTDVSLS